MALSEQQIAAKRKKLHSIFRTIRKNGPIERRQIQTLTQLSWGTVSQYTTALLNTGILKQTLSEAKAVGKTPLMLDINDSDNFIIGIDFNIHFIRIMMMDLKGNSIESSITPIVDASRMTDLLLEAVRTLLDKYPGKTFLAISISVQGSVDPEKGIAKYLSFEPTWRDLPLKDILYETFKLPVYTFHDPDCILYASKYYEDFFDSNVKNAILLNISLSIGMSFMTDYHRIYHSTCSHSGELGHTCVVPDGDLCSCGKQGCLEAYSSTTGIVNRFISGVNEGEKTILTKESAFTVTYDTIRFGAQNGDAFCLRLFQEAGTYLGRAIANVATLLEPDLIILYGEFANAKELFDESMQKAYSESVYNCNQSNIVYSTLGGTAPILGAAMYAQELIIEDFLYSAIEG